MNNYYTAPTDNNTPSYQQASIGNVPNYDAYVGGYMKRLQENGISLSNINQDPSKPYKTDNYATGEIVSTPNNGNSTTPSNNTYNQSPSSNYPLLARTMASNYLKSNSKQNES